MLIANHRVGPLVKKTLREVLDDNVLGLGAQTAYYFFFSLFPFFLFLAPILSLVGDKRETFSFLLEQLQHAVPADAYALVAGIVQSVVFTDDAPGLVSIGALLAIWSGSNVFSALMDALNTAYDLPSDPRPWWKKKLIAIACLIGVGLLFVVATVVMLAGGDIVDALADRLGIGGVGRIVWTTVQYALALGLLVGTGWIVYYFLPAVPQHKGHALVGSLVATALWVVVTLGFRFYVQNFGSYNKTYGTIGAVIVLLTWMYLSMVVLLIGGELASELRVGTGAAKTRAGHLYDGRLSTGGRADRPSVDMPERPATPRTERPAPGMGRAPSPAFVARPPRAD